MTERNVDARFREPVAAVLRPLDEGDRAIEVRLEVAPFLRVGTGDAVQVEVRDRHARLIAMADREGRAGDGLTDAESPCGTPHERGLPGPQIARDGHDVADRQLAKQTRLPRFRPLLWARF